MVIGIGKSPHFNMYGLGGFSEPTFEMGKLFNHESKLVLSYVWLFPRR